VCEPRERKRILRLLIEDVTLINGASIQVHVRLRGGATRSLTVAKPLPIAQIRKTKPEVVTEIDGLLDHYCDREVGEILNRQGRRTWQNEPFNLKKIAHIRRLQSEKPLQPVASAGTAHGERDERAVRRDVHNHQCLGKAGPAAEIQLR